MGPPAHPFLLATRVASARLLSLAVLALQLACPTGAQKLDPFPNATAGTFFSGVFSDNTVMQHGRAAAVYGVVVGATAGTKVTVRISEGAVAEYTVAAAVELTSATVKAGGLYAR